MIGPSFSIRPRAGYFAISVLDMNFFSLGLDMFFHPMGKGIEGFYLGPRYDVWIAAGNGMTGMAHMIGAMVGYKGIVAGGFAWGIGLGVQMNVANSVSSGSSTATFSYTGTFPAFDTEIGWAF
jgi:hypothetical protein